VLAGNLRTVDFRTIVSRLQQTVWPSAATTKQYFGTGPNVLGRGMAAGSGVKLARPDVPVVSVVGDRSFPVLRTATAPEHGVLRNAGHGDRAQ
jgi:thiamine pyrophosphate-dependent acetolactate synthase large subunit-like protein